MPTENFIQQITCSRTGAGVIKHDRVMDTATKYVLIFATGFFGGHIAQALYWGRW